MTNPDNDLFMKDRSLIREPERIRKCVSRVMGFPYERLKNEPAFRFIEAVLAGGDPTFKEGEPLAGDLGELIRLIADYDPDNSSVYEMFRGDSDSELRISIILMQALLRLIKSLSSSYPEAELLGYVSVRSLMEHYYINPHITADEVLCSLNRYCMAKDPSVKEAVRSCISAVQGGWDFLADSIEDYKQKKNLLCSTIYFIFVSALLNAAGKETSV